MEELLNILASLTGLDQTGVLLLLGIVVAIANFVGKLIPDDATGYAALIRKVAKVLGLYIENKRSGYVDMSRIRSPGVVGAIAIGLVMMVALSGCSILGIGLARAGTAAVCAGADAAQVELNNAVASNETERARAILRNVQTYCPSVFMALDLREAQLIGAVPAPSESSNP